MFRHCVAGIDFSAGWAQVHAQLKRMTSLLGIQQLTLVHVDEPRQWGHRDFTDAASSVRLEQMARDVQADLGIEVHPRFVSGLAAPAILEVAARQQADMIMVANRSHSRGRELVMGNVAMSLARMSTLPLLIIPTDLGSLEDGAPLLLVTDNSPAASRARACFAGLLGARQGRVMIVRSPQQTSLAEAETLEALLASHGNIAVDAVAGDPVAEVCRVAGEIKTPLIILGKHSGNAIDEPLLDNMVESLCRQTVKPLLLMPS